MSSNIKSILFSILGLVIAAAIFYSPSMSGKKLGTHDTLSVFEMSKEAQDYYDKGEEVYWTKSVFSGMPTYTFVAKVSDNFIGNLIYKFFHNLPYLFGHMLFTMLCFFIALKLLGIRNIQAMLFSILFGLNTFVVDSLVNGHVTKIMTFAGGSLAFVSFYLYMRKNNYWALIGLGLGLSINISCNHVQETYYSALMFLVAGIVLFILAIKEKTVVDFIKKSAIAFVVILLAVISNISLLYNLNDYSKETMRGGKTELTPLKGDNASTGEKGGLDINYAFGWSYQFTELLNFIAADAMGGNSNYTLKTKDSKLAQGIQYGEETITLPTYWGTQPFTGAPNYIGAIVMFLFILYFFYSQGKFRWTLLSLSILSMGMGLGKNFLEFNQLLFDYLPFYNKFRTPTMSFSIINITSLLGAALIAKDLFENQIDKDRLLKSLRNTGIFFGVIIVLFYVMISNQGFNGPSDGQLLQQNPNFPLDLLKEDRASLLKSDVLRAIGLIGLSAGLIWAMIKDKLKSNMVVYIILALAILDMWTVSKRYYSNDVFVDVPNMAELVPYESYNQVLGQDKSHYRVFNTTVNSFNDNYDGYRNANVGGYSPAKLYMYQDIIDRQLSQGSQSVYNMLNTKYFITNSNGQKVAQQNPEACGNAWFVNQVKFAKNADEEMDSLTLFNPKSTAFVDKRYQSDTKFDTNTDANATISLVHYHPDNMEYKATTSSGGYAVFSEIWYRGNNEWKAYIDGKEAKMVRTDYILRGLYIPAGTHKIEFKFVPNMLKTLLTVSFVSTIILLLFSLVLGWLLFKNNGELPFLKKKK